MSNANLLKSELKVTKNEQGILEINGVDKKKIIEGTLQGLTCYETVCAPREVEREKDLKISADKVDRIVKEILRCNICYEIYQDPVNIKTCLHKFCKKCIEDYNRKIKKECVLCRHPIETRRLMKEDMILKQISKEIK